MDHGYHTSSQNIEDFEIIEQSQTGIDKLLIDLVRGYPHLYDSTSIEYKNAPMKENSWSEIGTMMNMSVGDCQNRWLRLRERFGKELRLQDLGNRSGTKYCSKFALLNNMMFLKKHIKRRNVLTKLNIPIKKINFMRSNILTLRSITNSNIIPGGNQPLTGGSYDCDEKESVEYEIQNASAYNNNTTSNTKPQSSGPRSGLISSTPRNESQISQSSMNDFGTLPTEINESNNGKIKEANSANLKFLLATLGDTLQNRLGNKANQSDNNAWNINALTPEKSFGLLVAAELERIPEPEKTKRKQEIANILWRPA